MTKFTVNTVYGLTFQRPFSTSIHFQFENGLWKVRPNIQYLLEILSSFSNKMYKLLFTLFIIKLHARINIFIREGPLKSWAKQLELLQ